VMATLLACADMLIEQARALPVMAHRVLGRSSAFGELRLWDEGHLLAKARRAWWTPAQDARLTASASQ
jgi:hypothetical protein